MDHNHKSVNLSCFFKGKIQISCQWKNGFLKKTVMKLLHFWRLVIRCFILFQQKNYKRIIILEDQTFTAILRYYNLEQYIYQPTYNVFKPLQNNYNVRRLKLHFISTYTNVATIYNKLYMRFYLSYSKRCFLSKINM